MSYVSSRQRLGFLVLPIIILSIQTIPVMGMVAVSSDNKMVVRTGINQSTPQGNAWQAKVSNLDQIPAVLQQLALNDKGTAWAITKDGMLYGATSLTAAWQKVSGIVAQAVVVNNNYQVFSLDSNGNCFVRNNTSQTNPIGDSWRPFETGITLKSIAVSATSMWALDTDGNPYYRTGFNTQKPEGTAWTRVTGTSFSMISVNDSGHLWALKKNGDIYFRARITKDNPAGTAWRKVPGNAQSLSLLSDGTVFMVDKNSNIFARSGIQQGNPLGDRWQQTKVPTWLNNQYRDQTKFVVKPYGVFAAGKDVYNSYVVLQRQDQYLNMYKHHYFVREGVDSIQNRIGTDWSDKPYGLGAGSLNGRFMITDTKAVFIDSTGKSQDLDLPAAPSDGAQVSETFSFLTNEDSSLLFCFQQDVNQLTTLYARRGITPQAPMGSSWETIPFDGLGQGNITLFQNTLQIGDGHIWGLVYDQDAQKQLIIRRTGMTPDNLYGTSWVQVTQPTGLTTIASQIALIDGGVLVTSTSNPGDQPVPGVWFKPLMQPDSDGGDFVQIFSIPFDGSLYDKNGQYFVYVSTSLDGTIIVGRSFPQKASDGSFTADYLWWSAINLNSVDPKKTVWNQLAPYQKNMWSIMICPNSTIWGVADMMAYTRSSIVPAYAPGVWVAVDKPQNVNALGSSVVTMAQQPMLATSTMAQ